LIVCTALVWSRVYALDSYESFEATELKRAATAP
jgi:hypothetical protein